MQNKFIRTIYLYLYALIGLVLIAFGAGTLVDVGLRTYIFTEANAEIRYEVPMPKGEEIDIVVPVEPKIDYNRQQKQRDMSRGLSQILVGLPLWLYHWSVIKGDRRRKDEDMFGPEKK